MSHILRVSASKIAEALGGKKSGSGWIARCPAHDDKKPSLSVKEESGGKVLVKCHAGCAQSDVIQALKQRDLWFEPIALRPNQRRAKRTIKRERETKDRNRLGYAKAIWKESGPIEGTRGECYLRERGITIPLPEVLRFHPRLKHSTGGEWPGIVAGVGDPITELPVGIHRTFLSKDGKRKAPIEPNKMMLGPCRGGAVPLGNSDSIIMVGEGIETCLSAMQATGLPAWAALSTSGIRALELPQTIQEVIILADGDKAGEDAAQYAALRWVAEGRLVKIARAPRGHDFNDMLLGKAHQTTKAF